MRSMVKGKRNRSFTLYLSLHMCYVKGQGKLGNKVKGIVDRAWQFSIVAC